VLPETQTAPTRQFQENIVAVAILLSAWLVTTVVFWMGYVGGDDLFYARYAFLLHRPPLNWWEFRMPFILALRASFFAFGPSELAAALPTLMASLGILTAVIWFLGWTKRPAWQTVAGGLIAATLPLDVGFRSVPLAGFLAGGMLALGTVCLLKENSRVWACGSLLLATAFVTHEVSIFYVSILCLTALAFDRKRFFRPVLLCVVLSAGATLVECVVYKALLGDWLARFRMAEGTTSVLTAGTDPDTLITGLRFYTWPLENLLFCKSFGIDLILVLVFGILAWRSFKQEYRILFITMFLTWAWLGYGSQVPWAYKPFYRQMHYYFPLTFCIAVLLPYSLATVLGRRATLARGIVGVAVALHLACLAAGGRWGQNVDVSRDLLQYAKSHPDRTFLTDVRTMNQMYVLAGFRLPPNVVCLNGPGAEDLLVNKEPPGTPGFRFSELPVNGVLVNLEGVYHGGQVEAAFARYLDRQEGKRERIAPVQYRLLFRPFARFAHLPQFAVRSLGGEVRWLQPASRPSDAQR
jgi:hypothetical protein